jgi:saccharopine dehydrogenase-like NADP-dependent oxidoreductase
MKRILILGAGRSATALINFLVGKAKEDNTYVTVADMDGSLAEKAVGVSEFAKGIQLNALNEEERLPLIQEADVVISMLPAHLHIDIVKSCLANNKHIITPSYLTEEIDALHQEALDKNLLVLNELGLDPGIDHMSAMQIIDGIRNKGGEILEFESFTGGLLDSKTELTNPWRYKFTWNPRNVVLAGQGRAVKFIQNGTYKYIPYHKLFRRTEKIEIDEHGKFEGYANRDSLKYRSVYKLEDARTIFRGTLRRPGYCRAWDMFVQLGVTDDSYNMEGVSTMTHRDFFNSFLAYNATDSVELKMMHYLNLRQDDDVLLEKLDWIGVFSSELVGLEGKVSPAKILQHILEKKWTLEPHETDRCVMWHKFIYKMQDGVEKELHSSMVVEGEDSVNTSMALTVGLPLGIAARLILQGKLKESGVRLPIHASIYEPILEELKKYGVLFNEKHVS